MQAILGFAANAATQRFAEREEALSRWTGRVEARSFERASSAEHRQGAGTPNVSRSVLRPLITR